MNWFDSAQELLSNWKAKDAVAKAVADKFAKTFTPQARRVLDLAFKEAEQLNNNFIGTEHVLIGLVSSGQSVVVKVLQNLGLNPEAVRKEVENRVSVGPAQTKFGSLPFTPRMKKVLKAARQQAQLLNHTFVGAEHLLLGLFTESEGVAAQVFKHFNLNTEQMRKEILKELDSDCLSGNDEPKSLE